MHVHKGLRLREYRDGFDNQRGLAVDIRDHEKDGKFYKRSSRVHVNETSSQCSNYTDETQDIQVSPRGRANWKLLVNWCYNEKPFTS